MLIMIDYEVQYNTEAPVQVDHILTKTEKFQF